MWSAALPHLRPTELRARQQDARHVCQRHARQQPESCRCDDCSWEHGEIGQAAGEDSAQLGLGALQVLLRIEVRVSRVRHVASNDAFGLTEGGVRPQRVAVWQPAAWLDAAEQANSAVHANARGAEHQACLCNQQAADGGRAGEVSPPRHRRRRRTSCTVAAQAALHARLACVEEASRSYKGG